LLEDAGLDHDYVRSVRDEKWEELKAQLVKEGVHSCTQPYIQVNGQKFFKTVPIMRYISAKLDYKYHGSTPEENHLLDVITELADSWFNSMRAAFYSSDVSYWINIRVLWILCSNVDFIGTKKTSY
jgi:hypothetical protein